MSNEWPKKPNIPFVPEKNKLEEKAEKTKENPAEKKPPEAEDEKAVKKELSPEVMEMIMNKIQDINKDGIAYTVTSTANIKSTFKDGLLGYDWYAHAPSGRGKDFGSENSKQHWLKKIRRRNSYIWFNIVGRSRHRWGNENELEIGRDTWLNEAENTVALLFDISNFKEKKELERKNKYEHGFFYSCSDGEDGKVKDIHGFRLSDRIAPVF